MDESDAKKRPDKAIDLQSHELHGLLAATPPLARAFTGAIALACSLGIGLFAAYFSSEPSSVCLLTCLTPFAMIGGAVSSVMFCGNAAASCVGIRSKWPHWVAFAGALASMLVLPASFFAEESGALSPSGKKFGMETFVAGAAIFGSVSYSAAMYRANEYGKACCDRWLCILAIVSQVILVLTVPAVFLLLLYFHLVKDSEYAVAKKAAAAICFMSLAVLATACRAASTVGQASRDSEREVRGRSDS